MENESSAVTTANKTPEDVTGWVQSVMDAVVQTSFGQTILKLSDNFLWIIEKSAEWSLPCQEVTTDESGKAVSKLELVRPLPWILFLPGLVILRTIRVGINVGAFVLGYPQIQPSSMVKFVQRGRRRLRAIKTSGLRNLKRKSSNAKDKRLSMNEAKKALIRSIRLTLSTLSCLDGSKPSLSPPPTRIHVSALDLDAATTPEEKSATESTGSPMHSEKRKYSVVISSDDSFDESEHEILESKINRLALESSTDDPDFNPEDCSTSCNASDNDETDPDISANEVSDITEDAKSLVDNKELEPANVESKQEQPPEQKTPRPKESCDTAERITSSQNVDSTEFLSPKTSSQDGDADFYSPISSKGGTPERSVSPSNEKTPQADSLMTNEFGNGEVSFSQELMFSGQSSEETNNGVVIEKRSTNVSKPHHKGKRASHGNRKKK